MGFLGLTYSGKDLLVDLLTGKIAEGNGKKDIYLGGIQVKDWKELNGYIYRIHVENYQIDDWTVAEYLGLVESGGWGGLLRRGEVIPSVELTYTADTKNYIDGKIASYHAMAQANQIAMMSLLPDETQATMIEKDQENLLGGI